MPQIVHIIEENIDWVQALPQGNVLTGSIPMQIS